MFAGGVPNERPVELRFKEPYKGTEVKGTEVKGAEEPLDSGSNNSFPFGRKNRLVRVHRTVLRFGK